MLALLLGNLGKHVSEKLPEKRIVQKRRLLHFDNLGGLNRHNGGSNRIGDALVRLILPFQDVDIRPIQCLPLGQGKIRKQVISLVEH